MCCFKWLTKNLSLNKHIPEYIYSHFRLKSNECLIHQLNSSVYIMIHSGSLQHQPQIFGFWIFGIKEKSPFSSILNYLSCLSLGWRSHYVLFKLLSFFSKPFLMHSSEWYVIEFLRIPSFFPMLFLPWSFFWKWS